MVRRETDPAFINALANSESVRPFIDHVGGDGPLDLSPTVGRAIQTGVIWLSNGEDAAAAFEQTGDRTWDAHVLFGPTHRGRAALETARAMLDYMRPWTDEIWGLVPVINRAALWFARRLGFVPVLQLDDPKMGRCEALVWRPS